MKKLSYIFLILITLSFASCSSDDSSNNGESELYIKYTFNSVSYDFEPTTITSLQKLIMGEKEINSVYNRISLWMPTNPSLGSHEITDETPTNNNLETLHNAELWVGNDTYTATSGTIVVTEINDEYIKGTFTFTGDDGNGTTVSVTDGSFRAYR
ncbi:hypothetical protein SY27_05170 [Flavobacterium sp. 316]|uniref:hypothetical protein n=1 Tax=Flavobacterium sp. 316 TaxID=1603293 RepID=UPI0005E531A0|nr:hypothetical protein [Flavobacterium sp. 316]KIX22061.1 hypothetical protein SY27_05170 [Flavobacterium sp. 316]